MAEQLNNKRDKMKKDESNNKFNFEDLRYEFKKKRDFTLNYLNIALMLPQVLLTPEILSETLVGSV